MSYHEYRVSEEIAQRDYPFYALIMAAMRKADTLNAAILRQSFPAVWAEVDVRYNAPGGLVEGD